MRLCALYHVDKKGSVSLRTGRREPVTKERIEGILCLASIP